jgi:hypothetical protein
MSGQSLLDVLVGRGVLLEIGLMVALAMFIGFYLYDQTNTKNTIWRIIAPGVVFLVFLAWIYYSIFRQVNHPLIIEPIAIMVGVGILFLAGFSAGTYMSITAVRKRHRIDKKYDTIIGNIKTNGGESPLDVKTEPVDR